ncbi:hypothetical protein GGI15_004151 [Coemansia interrupta]|uniref:Uncharacterized protein n=1 Tax=Coemansia interrupta TaxID=1126814 RepID=A0A9W8LFM7_9FUNG|nr:hypothetical protein GGI15_004151 [Coemansia interrupta]
MAVNIDLVGFEGLEEYGAEQQQQQQQHAQCGHTHMRPNSHPAQPSDVSSPHRISRRSSSGLSSSPTSSSSGSGGGMNTPPNSGRSGFSSRPSNVRKRSNSGGIASADSGLPFADVLDNRMRFYQENYECAFCRKETKTFDAMKAHIALEHPWFDLSLHQNIR